MKTNSSARRHERKLMRENRETHQAKRHKNQKKKIKQSKYIRYKKNGAKTEKKTTAYYSLHYTFVEYKNGKL